MPITANTDYIPTIDEFLAHWGTADAETLSNISFDGSAWDKIRFQVLRNDLDIATTGFQTCLNDLEISRLTLAAARNAVADHVTDFNRRVRVEFGANPRFSRLPESPNRTAGRAVFLDAMDDMIDLWNRVNASPSTPAFTPPLVLIAGTTLAQFTVLRQQLDAAFISRTTFENAVAHSRVERNLLQDRAYEFMKQYRLTIEARFPANSPEMLTLPRLTPADGHTPEPVVLSAAWSAADGKAKLEWTASDDPQLQDYQVRAVPGEAYDAASETIVTTIPAGSPRVLLTATGLSLPGSAVGFRVYVRLTTGNTRASEAIIVRRPG